MQTQDLSSADLSEVVTALLNRCDSQRQFERALAFVVAGDRLDYRHSTFYRRREEVYELLALPTPDNPRNENRGESGQYLAAA